MEINKHKTKFRAIPVKTEVVYINDRGTEKKASHDGFQCMGCQMFPIIGNRFKCTVLKILIILKIVKKN